MKLNKGDLVCHRGPNINLTIAKDICDKCDHVFEASEDGTLSTIEGTMVWEGCPYMVEQKSAKR